jgi:2-desacetyl-2-hydroxyethyl bacteriochlorophyllide A dehydrogenase
MKAIVCNKYGSSGLELKDVKTPEPKDNEVLIEVHASSVTTHNLVMVTGKPFFVRFMAGGLLKPKLQIPGSDLAGKVITVGKNVTQFKPGDEVFAEIFPLFGAYAEFVSVPESTLSLKPVNLTYEEAAATPQVALVALQGLRDKGQIQKGKKVLIYGASGGIGTFAVQIAKYYGAEVTGVCSTRNLDMVRSLGADNVIDYTKDDFSKNGEQYDLIFAIANCSIHNHLKALKAGGIYVSTGSPSIPRLYQDMFLGPKISKKQGKKVMGGWTVAPNQADLAFIKELIETGKIKPVIDKIYPLSNTIEAFQYYAKGHSRGKVVIEIDHKN